MNCEEPDQANGLSFGSPVPGFGQVTAAGGDDQSDRPRHASIVEVNEGSAGDRGSVSTDRGIGAREATRQMLAGSMLGGEAEEGLVGAVSEVVTNANLHGRPPVRVRGWLTANEAVITVTDEGEGPTDPEAGLRPAARGPGEGGLGLWLAHQMCSEVVMVRHTEGFTVRLVARAV